MIRIKTFISAFLFFFLICLCISAATHAIDYPVTRGAVIKVIDGDTVVIRPYSGQPFNCRLYGIDAPEISRNKKPGQPHGNAAERELMNLVLNTTVDVTLTGKSSFDLDICIIKKMRMDICLEMVRRGYAWAYREYLSGPYMSDYVNAETEARKMRRGLWQQVNPTPPWEFRRNYRFK